MALVLEMKNGDLITPRSIFDIMDVVEEMIGVEVRQYIETYLESGNEPLLDEGEADHYMTVLENIEDEASGIENLLAKKGSYRKQIYEKTDKIRSMINRERRINGKAYV